MVRKEFYHFQIKNSETSTTNYYYTDSKTSITKDGNIYIPLGLKRSEIVYNEPVSDLKIEFPFDTHPFTLKEVINNKRPISLILYQTDVYGNYRTLYSGTVNSITHKNNKILDVVVKSQEVVFDTLIPKQVFKSQCDHSFGKNLCPVNEDDYKVTVTGASIANLNFGEYSVRSSLLKVLESWGEWRTFKFGRLVVTNGSVEEHFYIIKSEILSTEVKIYTSAKLPSTFTGTTIFDFYAGCDKNQRTCYHYGAAENFGGFPYVPRDNPFEVSVV